MGRNTRNIWADSFLYIYDREAHKEYYNKVNKFCEDKLFNAELDNARIYVSEGSAMTSIGILHTDWRTADQVYRLPNHLEIHEIKRTFVCVVKPDSSSNCNDE